MNKLYVKNEKIEWIIIMLLSIVSLYYQFERIIFLTAIAIFLFSGFYSKYRDKDKLVNQEHELLKMFSYIFFFVIIIRYLIDPMLPYDTGTEIMRTDWYLSDRIIIVLIIHGILLLYKNNNKRRFTKVNTIKNNEINKQLVSISLLLCLVYLYGNILSKLILKLLSIILHFLIGGRVSAEKLPIYLIITIVTLFFAGNFISMSLIYLYYLNIKDDKVEENIEQNQIKLN